MADPSEPHESSASAESHGFESTYTAHVNELESFLHSIEESEEHDSKQTNVAPSGIDDTERATACSAECQQLLSKEEESRKESIHPSTLMADPSGPYESSASAEYDDFESAYAARVNELESVLCSVEESEEHDSKQTKVAPSGSNNTVGGTTDKCKVPPPPGFSTAHQNTQQVHVLHQETPEELLARWTFWATSAYGDDYLSQVDQETLNQFKAEFKQSMIAAGRIRPYSPPADPIIEELSD